MAVFGCWCCVDDEKGFWREAPPMEVALTCLELGGAGLGRLGSPPRSVRVFRFNGFDGGGAMDEERALLAEADISISLPGEGILLGGRRCEGN